MRSINTVFRGFNYALKRVVVDHVDQTQDVDVLARDAVLDELLVELVDLDVLALRGTIRVGADQLVVLDKPAQQKLDVALGLESGTEERMVILFSPGPRGRAERKPQLLRALPSSLTPDYSVLESAGRSSAHPTSQPESKRAASEEKGANTSAEGESGRAAGRASP